MARRRGYAVGRIETDVGAKPVVHHHGQPLQHSYLSARNVTNNNSPGASLSHIKTVAKASVRSFAANGPLDPMELILRRGHYTLT